MSRTLRQRPLLAEIFRKIFPKRIFNLNVRQNGGEKTCKRALISYIVPKHLEYDKLKENRMAGRKSLVMVLALNDMGYCVDLIDYRDTEFVSEKVYDIFIGHGGVNFKSISERIKINGPMIYYSTGFYWKEHNRQEKERFENLELRKGVRLPYDRYIFVSEAEALKIANLIIGVGNKKTLRTYSDFDKVCMINNMVIAPESLLESENKFEDKRNNFLFFSGRGNVHKGLDLLIDVFKGLENQHLWICTSLDKQFKVLFARELDECKNIHVVGHIITFSQQHKKLADKCNWIILPSCSEGQSSSILENMALGLVPVISAQCGIDTKHYGVEIGDCTIEPLRALAEKLSFTTEEKWKRMSVEARKTVIDDYTVENFRENIRNAILGTLQ